MEEESVTESEWSSESSSESDWLSENEEKKGQQGGKRRMKTRSCKEREQTETASLKKRGTKRKTCSNSSQCLGQQINNKAILPVTCGDKEGSLYLEKYKNSVNCILSEGQWFKPTDFEKFGGKEMNKKWKTSILLYGVPLQKYIEDGHLSSPVFKKSRPHDEQSKEKEFPCSSESERRNSGHNQQNDDNNDDVIDLTEFEGPTIPVTCRPVSVILHKCRFTTGFGQSYGEQIKDKTILPVTCGDKEGSLYLEKYKNSENCILSEGQWFKPTDFEKFGGKEMNKKWKTSILLYGVPLQKYIEDGNLSCPVFLGLMSQKSLALKEPQEMEEESVTESEWNSESDWLSENEGKKGQQGGKRRMKTRSCKEREQTETASLKKKGTKRKTCSNSSQSLGQQIKDKPIHPVTCGDKEGSLYLEKYDNSVNCILSEGQWFKPTDYEKFGGKEMNKKWKTSILLYGVPLQKYIEDGHLSSPVFRKSRPPDEQSKKKEFPCSSESERMDSGHNQQNDDNNDDVIDLTEFEGPTLPVTCGSVSGILHKYRFATGLRGKCIRTDESWLTPDEFVKQDTTLTDPRWKKNIRCHGKTLYFLLKKEILRIHSLLCECDFCSNKEDDLLAQRNDDVCYECHSDGDLVCCDECPRAFHSHCHLPAVEEDSSGDWMCNFCVLRTSQQRKEALNLPVSQDTLDNEFGRMGARLKDFFDKEFQKIFTIQ